MLDFKLFVDLFTPPFIQLSKFADLQNILLDFWVQLLLKDRKDIPRAYEPISVLVVEHERYQMGKSNTHVRKSFPDCPKLFVVDIRAYLEKADQPLGKALSNNRGYVVFQQIFV